MTARIYPLDDARADRAERAEASRELLGSARRAALAVLSEGEVEAMGLVIHWRSDVALWRGK